MQRDAAPSREWPLLLAHLAEHATGVECLEAELVNSEASQLRSLLLQPEEKGGSPKLTPLARGLRQLNLSIFWDTDLEAVARCLAPLQVRRLAVCARHFGPILAALPSTLTDLRLEASAPAASDLGGGALTSLLRSEHRPPNLRSIALSSGCVSREGERELGALCDKEGIALDCASPSSLHWNH